MKAYSCNIEISIKLTDDEIKRLEKSSLEGLLKFWFREEDKKRNIPITIRYDPSCKELFKIEQIPKEGYMGDSEKINFIINKGEYNALVNESISGGRFGIGGKLIIMSEDFEL